MVSLGIQAFIKGTRNAIIYVYTSDIVPIYVTTVHFNLVVYSSIYYVKSNFATFGVATVMLNNQYSTFYTLEGNS